MLVLAVIIREVNACCSVGSSRGFIPADVLLYRSALTRSGSSVSPPAAARGARLTAFLVGATQPSVASLVRKGKYFTGGPKPPAQPATSVSHLTVFPVDFPET